MWHSLRNNSMSSSAKQPRNITTFEVLPTKQANNSNLVFNLIELFSLRSNWSVLHQACRIQRWWDHCKIVTTLQMLIFKWHFPWRCRSQCLSSPMIWLVECGYKIARTCSTHLSIFLWRNVPNDDMKFSNLTYWRQREPTTVNLSFSIFYHSFPSCKFPNL